MSKGYDWQTIMHANRRHQEVTKNVVSTEPELTACEGDLKQKLQTRLWRLVKRTTLDGTRSFGYIQSSSIVGKKTIHTDRPSNLEEIKKFWQVILEQEMEAQCKCPVDQETWAKTFRLQPDGGGRTDCKLTHSSRMLSQQDTRSLHALTNSQPSGSNRLQGYKS